MSAIEGGTGEPAIMGTGIAAGAKAPIGAPGMLPGGAPVGLGEVGYPLGFAYAPMGDPGGGYMYCPG